MRIGVRDAPHGVYAWRTRRGVCAVCVNLRVCERKRGFICFPQALRFISPWKYEDLQRTRLINSISDSPVSPEDNSTSTELLHRDPLFDTRGD